MPHPNDSYTPPGLIVRLDALEHRYAPEETPPGRPHLFTYHLTIDNRSAHTVTLLARKWVIGHRDGSVDVIEGDRIVGETPRLEPGQHFSYHSFHLASQDCRAEGAFFGLDENQRRVHVRIPPFEMPLPPDFLEE